MLYRYRMHGFADPMAPLGPGRPLFGRTAAEAIVNAADLCKEGIYASNALGYCVVDTEDGSVLWQRQRERGSVAAAQVLPPR
ncbi:MAG TPA: hypothetical protein VGK33_04775 [Chloroflexota bacterium]|jgi:poly(3-hydroxybutyrate) depolymerase